MSVLIVNEARILAAKPEIAEWWRVYRSLLEKAGLVTLIVVSIGGDRLRIDCESDGHAAYMSDYMRGRGVPRTAIKRVKR